MQRESGGRGRPAVQRATIGVWVGKSSAARTKAEGALYLCERREWISEAVWLV